MAIAELPKPTAIRDYEPIKSSTIRGGFALGLGVFLVLLTGCMGYVAWGDLPSHIDRPNLPPNLFAGFMFCFFGAPGLFLISVGITDLANDARVRRGRTLYPTEPWRWDYSWNTDSARDISLHQAANGLLAWTLGLGIIIPLNYIVFVESDASFILFPQVILGLFDLLLLLSLGTVVYRILVQLIHGRATLRYQSFPLRLGQQVDLALMPQTAFQDMDALQVTLRCVEEACEAKSTASSAAGQSASATTVQKIGMQHYVEQRPIDRQALRSSDGVALMFELPACPELKTRLSDRSSVHWELLVSGKRPGFDYEKRFLLPVY